MVGVSSVPGGGDDGVGLQEHFSAGETHKFQSQSLVLSAIYLWYYSLFMLIKSLPLSLEQMGIVLSLRQCPEPEPGSTKTKLGVW